MNLQKLYENEFIKTAQNLNTPQGLGRQKTTHSITPLSNITTQYSIQEHNAKKAGKHFDLRIIDPKQQNIAHSWAIKHFPIESGEKRLAIRTPSHSRNYSLKFEGVLGKGYGEGTVKMFDKGRMKIKSEDDNKISFNIKSGINKGDFSLINTGNKKDDKWLIIKK